MRERAAPACAAERGADASALRPCAASMQKREGRFGVEGICVVRTHVEAQHKQLVECHRR